MTKRVKKVALELIRIPEAHLCTSNCANTNRKGETEPLYSKAYANCVGCGVPCHLSCHGIPRELIDAFDKIPKADKQNAFFGEKSYMRIVCQNCSNWLLADAPESGKPSFAHLFTRVANKALKDEAESVAQNDDEKINGSKRKKPEEDDNKVDMYEVMMTCVRKINEIQTISAKTSVEINNKLDQLNAGQNGIKKELENINQTVKYDDNNVKSGISDLKDVIQKSLTSIENKLDSCSSDVKSNEKTFDDVIQKGFNNLKVTASDWLSPLVTPKRNDRNRDSVRRMAFSNTNKYRQMNNDETPKSRFTQFSRGPKIPTENGESAVEDIFGPSVKRPNFNERVQGDRDKMNRERVNQKSRSTFKHAKAVYIRFVDPSISTSKMLEIVTRDTQVKEAYSNDPSAIEITRLVKKSLSEDDILKLKNGISFRVGCVDTLYSSINDKKMWASHWQVREWDSNFKSDYRPKIEKENLENASNLNHNPDNAFIEDITDEENFSEKTYSTSKRKT